MRAHQHAAGAQGGQENQAIGRTPGGLTSKLHLCMGAAGNPDFFILSPGQDHDVTKAEEISGHLAAGSTLLADKGYDSSDFRIALLVKNINPQIPSRKNRLYKPPYDQDKYRNRSRIERFFAKLKQYRGFATRYDKLAHSFLSQVALACAIISISTALNF